MRGKTNTGTRRRPFHHSPLPNGSRDRSGDEQEDEIERALELEHGLPKILPLLGAEREVREERAGDRAGDERREPEVPAHPRGDGDGAEEVGDLLGDGLRAAHEDVGQNAEDPAEAEREEEPRGLREVPAEVLVGVRTHDGAHDGEDHDARAVVQRGHPRDDLGRRRSCAPGDGHGGDRRGRCGAGPEGERVADSAAFRSRRPRQLRAGREKTVEVHGAEEDERHRAGGGGGRERDGALGDHHRSGLLGKDVESRARRIACPR